MAPRGDLTAAERRKKLVRQAAEVKRALHQRAERMDTPEGSPDGAEVGAPRDTTPEEGGEFSLDSKENSRGRPAQPDAEAHVAEALGVSRASLTQAKKHVAVMEKYALLEGPDVSQNQALELVKLLDALPEPRAKGRPSKAVSEELLSTVDKKSGRRGIIMHHA